MPKLIHKKYVACAQCSTQHPKHKCQKCKKYFCKKHWKDHKDVCGVVMVGRKRRNLFEVEGIAGKKVRALLLVAYTRDKNEEATIKAITKHKNYASETYVYNVMSGRKSNEDLEVYIMNLIRPYLWLKDSDYLEVAYDADVAINKESKRREKFEKRELDGKASIIYVSET